MSKDSNPILNIGTKIEIIRDSMSPYQSPNTRLVASARASRFEWGIENPFMDGIEEMPDGTVSRTVTWVMNAGQKREFIWAERDEAGNLVAKSEEIDFNEFRRRYLDRAWITANPDHPISYLYATHWHHMGMLKRIKELPQHVIIRHGKRTASIPTNASPEDKERALRAIRK